MILVVLFGEVVEDGDCAHGATPEAELVDSLGAFEMEEDVFEVLGFIDSHGGVFAI